MSRPHLRLVGFVLASCVLYFARLGSSPPYLSIEEVAVAQQALTLAETGRDDSGRWLPLFITEAGTDVGGGPHDPMWVYAGAALLKVAPFSEALMRTPSALAGVVDVLLMFLVSRRLFRSETLGWTGAIILALTPAHYMQSRIGSQQIGAVPFVLLWMLFVARYLDSGRRRDLVLASVALGVGTYSYIAAAVFLPCCYVATLVAIARCQQDAPVTRRGKTYRDLSWATVAFCVTLVPMLVWHVVAAPERLQQLLSYYTAHGYNEDLDGSGFLSSYWVVTRLDLWWNTFNPERMLFAGDSDYRYSTRQVGYLLLPSAVFLSIGAFQFHRFVPKEFRVLTVVVLLLSPMPAVLAGDLFIKRWLPALPFLALLATAGVAAALSTRRWLFRGAAAALAVATAIQFFGFFRHYHGPYHADANAYFSGNIHGVVREVLGATDDPACVLVDRRIEMVAQWRLYTRARGARQFAEGYNSVDAERPDFSAPPACRRSSLVVLADWLRESAEFGPRLEANGWQKTSIPEPQGKTIYVVYRRSGT